MVIFKKNDLPSKVQVYESAEEETMANTLEKKNYLVPVICQKPSQFLKINIQARQIEFYDFKFQFIVWTAL